MGDIQSKALTDGGQGGGGQGHDLANIVGVQVSDALQTRLQDLLEAVGAARDAVDVLIVADLLLFSGAILTVFDDGQGNVGLESQQLAPHVGEGNDAVADQKVLVADVQIVLLEFTHFKGEIPVPAVQLPQGVDRPFFGLEIGDIHGDISLCGSIIFRRTRIRPRSARSRDGSPLRRIPDTWIRG